MMKKHLKKLWIKWPSFIVLGVIVLFFGLYASVYLGFWGKIPTKNNLSDLSQMESSRIYDKDSVLIGKYFITDREIINYNDLPEELIQALIATEDARFYQHNGVDERSLLRVFFKTILMGDRSSGGGSTITLQLAKNLYGREDYGFLSIVINKLRESFVARRLEEVYSKQEILTLYFNTVPFSGNTYGVESAAHKFFNTSTSELTLSQAAALVGTLKANHRFNPRLFPEKSLLRRNVVLRQMVKYGYLSQKEAQNIEGQGLKIDYHSYASSTSLAPYFRERVKRQVEQILSSKEYRKPNGEKYDFLKDGLSVYTTLDVDLQRYAEEAVRKRMIKLQTEFEKNYGQNPPWKENSSIVQKALKKLPVYKRLKRKGMEPAAIIDSLSAPKRTELFAWKRNKIKSVSIIDSLRHYLKFLNAGLVSVDPYSGGVRAYVGGIDYRYFQYDHVYQSRRQVGSVFKPFVYAAALENGLKPCDYFPVRAVTYADQQGWTPKNANANLDPEMNYSMTAALTHSLNTITVKVLRETGINNTIDQVHKMGIDQEIAHVPSIALGTSNISLIDVAQAYTSFLGDGRPKTPHLINRIEDRHGKLIVDFSKREVAPKAFSEHTRETMLEMLKNVVNKGTARRLRNVYHFRNDLAGKTGTTQDNTDGWFVGLLPNLVTVSWVGNDNSRIKFPSTSIGQGANSALPIFARMLQSLNRDTSFDSLTQARFKEPSPKVVNAMACTPTKKEGFFKRLFHKNKPTENFNSGKSQKRKDKWQRSPRKKKKKEKKKGFFQRLFGGGKS